MTESLRDILTAVREGRLDPDEAARLLADPAPPSPEEPPATALPVTDEAVPRPVAAPVEGEPVNLAKPSASAWADAVDDPSAGPVEPVGAPTATSVLRLRAMTRRVRVIADPAVTTVAVEGPHELRREGSTLILESDRDLPFGDPFSFLPSFRGGFRLQPGLGLPRSLGGDLVVRLNPGIDLEVDVTAGSLSVQGGSRVRARVTAGSARIEGTDGPLDLHVVGGTAKVDMTVRGRDNRIRCESGSINLRLRGDSDVRMRPDAQLGRIVIDGVDGGREIVVGAGTGRLDVEIVMGNLQVEVERE